VRKAPISADDAVVLVRKHRKAFAKRGTKLMEFDPKKATDDEIKSAFLGREGTLRAPTITVGNTILGGWDEATWVALTTK
jgi:hypothetical protein